MIENVAFRLVLVFFVLFIGFFLSKLGSKYISYAYRKKRRPVLKRVKAAQIFTMVVMLMSILASLFFLQIDVSSYLLATLYNLMPNIISVILLLVAIIIIVNLFVELIEKFLSKSGLTDFLREYQKEVVLAVMLGVVRIVLYVVFGLAALSAVGVDVVGISSALWLFFYPFLIFSLALVFWAVRDLAENYSAGLYLKYSKGFKIGETIRMGKRMYTIKEITSQGVTAVTGSRDAVFIPNRKFLKEVTRFKDVRIDLETVEDIKSHFVAQDPSYCGPASASMVLSVFGYNISQQKIAEGAGTRVGVGTHPKRLIRAVERLTKKGVIGCWIGFDEIADLRREICSWLGDDGLVIVDYKKSHLFPESEKAHYSVCLAVEGEELVLLDPNPGEGGIYLADVGRVRSAMDTRSELIGGKRGYIVLAPKGSRAYYRIKEGLVYSELDLYKKTERKLRQKFRRFMPRGQILDFPLPASMRNYIKKHRKRQKVARVWEPEGKK